MKCLLALALAVSLSACATTSGTSIALASATIMQVQANYDAARGLARLFMPYLPDDRRAQIAAIPAGSRWTHETAGYPALDSRANVRCGAAFQRLDVVGGVRRRFGAGCLSARFSAV